MDVIQEQIKLVECRKCHELKTPEQLRKGDRKLCKHCSVINAMEWRRKNKQKARLRDRCYYERNRERIRARAKEGYQKHRSKRLQYLREFAKKYPWKMQANQRHIAVHPIIFSAYMQQQYGLCAICHQATNGKCFHIDHSHESGIVRGLLCSNCNLGIGYLMDDPTLLRRAADYLDGRTGFDTNTFEKVNCLIREAS